MDVPILTFVYPTGSTWTCSKKQNLTPYELNCVSKVMLIMENYKG